MSDLLRLAKAVADPWVAIGQNARFATHWSRSAKIDLAHAERRT